MNKRAIMVSLTSLCFVIGFLITLTGQSTPVYITAIGPKRQVEEQKWSIVWDLVELHRELANIERS